LATGHTITSKREFQSNEQKLNLTLDTMHHPPESSDHGISLLEGFNHTGSYVIACLPEGEGNEDDQTDKVRGRRFWASL
jgi:hypothetical protein